MTFGIAEKVPKFYGAVTVGERGQIAIPAEARRELDIHASTRLLAFGSVDTKVLMFVKMEFMTEFLSTISSLLRNYEHMLKTGQVEAGKPGPDADVQKTGDTN